jgi:hypothetical protein
MRKGLTQILTSKRPKGTSVLPVSYRFILCHNCVRAVAYVRRKRSLEVKLLIVPGKWTSANTSYKRRFSNRVEIYSRVFQHRNRYY